MANTINISSIQNNTSVETPGGTNQGGTVKYPSSMYNPPQPPTVIDDWLSAQNTLTPLRIPSETGKYYTILGVSEYSRKNLMAMDTRDTKAQFILPLPLQLINHNSVKYDDKAELGVLWGLGNKLVSGNFNVNNISDFLGGTLGGSAAALSAIPGIGTYTNIGTGVFGGFTSNQFLTVLLKGPEYKQFKLEFLISPKTAVESETLRTIIRKSNNFMAARWGPVSQATFDFPMIFNIGFSPNPKYLFRFKPSVLVNFTTNYSPSGIPAFYKANTKTFNQNAPETVRLQYQFLELEYWLRGDFKDSNDMYDTIGPRGE